MHNIHHSSDANLCYIYNSPRDPFLREIPVASFTQLKRVVKQQAGLEETANKKMRKKNCYSVEIVSSLENKLNTNVFSGSQVPDFLNYVYP